jgi:NADH-quinone oxidoreductase subunit L
MPHLIQFLWLIPAIPLLMAGFGALLKREQRRLAATLAISGMAVSLVLSCIAFSTTLGTHPFREVWNFRWFDLADGGVQLGWVLDPLTAIMLVMVTFLSLLIFIYSVGYMEHDGNFTRFFCFLSLFAAAMLGIVISNSLLLLFISWELVGLSSYLLIGFWFEKPEAAAAAKKAFITTRIGDMGLLLGMLWLYHQSGTLLFYDAGHGCLEQSSLALLAGTTVGGMALSTVISLLIFAGAAGKSGQVPLHVWLPDAMEGPTPVSALIHAATMVAAGVFLVARVYPLLTAGSSPVALEVVTWIGAITAVLAAAIAVAQNDIKRIIAYSTISQLGYMMMGLGVGGVSVGMFHLITHAFFKSLLFLGAGSVIHGCHGTQDIRHMGGLRKLMPWTFATYAAGMLALCGVPLFFSGFWSKDEILRSAHAWSYSSVPFYLGLVGAFLTAFYMTRQVSWVFFGKPEDAHHPAHESPPVMTIPLAILAVFAVLAGFLGTPAWPWFQTYLNGETVSFLPGALIENSQLNLMLLSTLVVGASFFTGWRIYSKVATRDVRDKDPLEKAFPAGFRVLQNKFYVDEFYAATIIRFNAAFARFADWLDRVIWSGAVNAVSALTLLCARFNRIVDESGVNAGFDAGCEGLRDTGGFLSWLENGRIQRYLRLAGLGVSVLAFLLIWGAL